jgi:hypothetical protein
MISIFTVVMTDDNEATQATCLFIGSPCSFAMCLLCKAETHPPAISREFMMLLLTTFHFNGHQEWVYQKMITY